MRPRKSGCVRWAVSVIFIAPVLSIAVIACLAYYALKIEPRWIEITRQDVKFTNYPAGAPPLKIVLVGDIHFGPHNDEKYVRRVVKTINGLSPDITLLAGDFDSREGYAAQCANALKGLKAARGKYAVFGGHDYQQGPRILERELQKAGIRVLKNGNVKLEDNIWLIAIDDFSLGRPDVQTAFAGVPWEAVRIVITHNPKIFPRIRDRNCVVLTAHTHAGQLDVPGIPRNRLPGLLSYEYIRGWYHDGNSRLYVNRGIGTVIPYIRFRARPEISLFLISRGTPDVAGMRVKEPLDRRNRLKRLIVRGFRILKPLFMKIKSETVD